MNSCQNFSSSAPSEIAHAIFDGKFWILVGRRGLQRRRQVNPRDSARRSGWRGN